MPESIERSRYGCNLHGAIQTLSAITGVVPIVHSTPGCGIQNYIANGAGGSSSGYLAGYTVPNSNVYEKQVIFGGTSRLREQIKNTVKVVNGDLYVTLSGCEAEMVGDDIISMTQEIVEQGESAIYYKAPGFKGDQHIGYAGVIDAILSQLPEVTNMVSEKEDGLVNLLGIIPKQDLYWQGNLNEIERILQHLGVKVNKLLGYQQTIDHWKKIPSAQLNVVVSKWGVNLAKKLEQSYGTPFIYIEDPGLELDHIEDFVKKVADQLKIDPEKVKEYLDVEYDRVIDAFSQISDYYFDYDFQRQAVIVGDESTVLRYGRFLSKHFGMEILAAIITDFTGEATKQVIPEEFKKFAQETYFTKDSREIDKIIENADAEIIFGSGLENKIAKKQQIPNYIISYPAFGKVIILKSDIGYQGAVNVIEELSSFLIEHKL
jgi:nitrogenase molybdenum-iron protein beta chain